MLCFVVCNSVVKRMFQWLFLNKQIKKAWKAQLGFDNFGSVGIFETPPSKFLEDHTISLLTGVLFGDFGKLGCSRYLTGSHELSNKFF